MVKRYPRILKGRRNRYFQKPKGIRDLGNQQGIVGNAFQDRKPSRKPKKGFRVNLSFPKNGFFRVKESQIM